MRLLNGLHLHELVLLAMGTLLFLLISAGFVVAMRRSQPYGKLLASYGLSIVMVGYPGIQSLEISENGVKMSRAVHRLTKQPDDKDARQSLRQAIRALEKRDIRDPQMSLTLAQAQLMLGNHKEATKYLNRAEREGQKGVDKKEVERVKQALSLDKDLAELSAKVEGNASDTKTRKELEQLVQAAHQEEIASPTTLTHLAQAQVLIGQKQQAQDSAKQAVKLDPERAQNVQIKRIMRLP